MNAKNIISLLGMAAVLVFLSAASTNASMAFSPEPVTPEAADSGPISSDPAQIQSAAEGTVLVTDNLNIDFSKHLVTFIELGADKCIPCKAMQPIMKEIAAEYKGQVQVVFYDVWKNPEPGRKYGIQLIPTQVFINKGGKEVYRHTGLFPKPELVAFLKKQGVR
ncbi:MAG: thioredoxin family protein [Acidobacteriota bacterium]|nr:thioredoxin family protein [Acidobacteriota bacterium]